MRLPWRRRRTHPGVLVTVRAPGAARPLLQASSDQLHNLARWGERGAALDHMWGPVELEFEAVLLDERGLVVARPVASRG